MNNFNRALDENNYGAQGEIMNDMIAIVEMIENRIANIGINEEPEEGPRRVREQVEGLYDEDQIIELPPRSPNYEGVGNRSPRENYDEEGRLEGMSRQAREIILRNQRIQENIRRANERIEEKKEEIKVNHGFDTSRYCQSSEDLFGTPYSEVRKIYIFIIEDKIFCFSREELFPSLNSRTMENQPFRYYDEDRSKNMYKLPIFGFINEKVFKLINKGEDTFKLTNPKEVLLSFQNYVKVYDGKAIDREEFIHNLV